MYFQEEIMDRKYCIFDSGKLCDDCGECEICDLDRTKKCNNCGKCIEMEGYDMRAIKIDEIIEDEENANVEEGNENEYIEDCSIENQYQLSKDYYSNKESIEDAFDNGSIQYIDDVDGLTEVLQNEENFKKLMHEEYPGLIKIKNNKKEKSQP
jgi:hypothetical protein